jgi:hypothetical protein
MWFAEQNTNRIGRITMDGVINEFTTCVTAKTEPVGIAAGPDGNMWFTESNVDQIGRITTPAGILPPTTVCAVSRKAHGIAGTFDLELSNVTTDPTTEPRQGPAHLIVFMFNKVVTAGIAQVTEGTATVGAPTFSGSEMRVPLTAVANQQYVTVSVSNVNSADGGTGGSASVRVGFLLGDVSQNRVVTVSDLALVNGQVARVVNSSNYLKDVNVTGTLSVADKAIANTQVTKALPAP